MERGQGAAAGGRDYLVLPDILYSLCDRGGLPAGMGTLGI